MSGNALYLRNFIAGEFVDAASSARIDIVDPATELVFATSPDSGQDDVDRALAAASAAVADWEATSHDERSALLIRIADAIEAHAQQLLEAEVRNTGKPMETTRHDEILRSAEHVRELAGLLVGMDPSTTFSRAIGDADRRELQGVVAVQVPWTYPFMRAVSTLARTLAEGRTIVLLPSDSTPVSVWTLAKLLAEIVPPGVVNVIFGGPATSKALLRKPHPDTSIFAGNPTAVVFDDVDLGGVAAEIVSSGFFNAGQDSRAISRVLAHSHIHTSLVTQLANAAVGTVTGGAHSPTTFYGPLISGAHRDQVEMLLQSLPDHSTIETGGHRVGDRGFYYAPTIVSGVLPADLLAQRRVLGPVIAVQRFDSEAEAIALANGVRSMFSASVWSSDQARANRVAEQLDSTLVSVNSHPVAAPEMSA